MQKKTVPSRAATSTPRMVRMTKTRMAMQKKQQNTRQQDPTTRPRMISTTTTMPPSDTSAPAPRLWAGASVASRAGGAAACAEAAEASSKARATAAHVHDGFMIGSRICALFVKKNEIKKPKRNGATRSAPFSFYLCDLIAMIISLDFQLHP